MIGAPWTKGLSLSATQCASVCQRQCCKKNNYTPSCNLPWSIAACMLNIDQAIIPREMPITQCPFQADPSSPLTPNMNAVLYRFTCPSPARISSEIPSLRPVSTPPSKPQPLQTPSYKRGHSPWFRTAYRNPAKHSCSLTPAALKSFLHTSASCSLLTLLLFFLRAIVGE